MQKSSRLKFNQLSAGIARAHGVDNAAVQFSVDPTHEQTLLDKITHNADFLQRINVVSVAQMKGEKIFGSASGLAPKRTVTQGKDGKDRQPQDPLTLTNKRYECSEVEFDYSLTYERIDAWAKFADFNQRFLGWCRKEMALSQIKVGWYGESEATETDSSANPNGEDVKKGWLQLLREYQSNGVVSQVLSEAVDGSNSIKLGKGGDYENLDAMVHDVKQLISEVHRNDPDLVAIIGSDLLATDKAQLYVAQGQKPSEKERIENQSVTRTYGGIPSVSVPFFPARGLLITKLSNLSIYIQSGSIRQQVMDNPKRKQIEHYNSMNLDYVVEDLEAAAMVEFKNVKLPDPNKTGDEAWQ